MIDTVPPECHIHGVAQQQTWIDASNAVRFFSRAFIIYKMTEIKKCPNISGDLQQLLS